VLDAAYEAEAVAVLQEALGVEADGVFGPKTTAALEAFTTAHPLLTRSETTTPLTWHLLEQLAHPTLAYRDRVLEAGDSGLDVAVLQEQLDVEPDGVFGPVTEQAVLDAQVAAELEPTGLVDAMTWAATDKGEGTGLIDGTGMEDDEPGFTMIDGVIVPSQADQPSEYDQASESDQPVEDD
nr:peptidoglycan-binding protein [Actinomycetota bacterium]